MAGTAIVIAEALRADQARAAVTTAVDVGLKAVADTVGARRRFADAAVAFVTRAV